MKVLVLFFTLMIWVNFSYGQTFEFNYYEPFNSNSTISEEITSDKNENIWVTRKGHFATNKSGSWVKTAVPDHDTTRFQRIIIPNDSTMWIDSWNNGIVKFINEQEVTHYTRDNSMLPIKRVEGIAYDEATNTIWAATQQGLVSIADNGDMQLFTSQNSALPSDEIYDVAVDDSGIIWVIADGSLLSINQGVWIDHNQFFFDSNDLYSLLPVSDGTLWVFHGGNIARTDGNNILEEYESSGATTTGAIDAEGRLWTDETIQGLRILKDRAQFFYSKDLEEDDPIDQLIFKIHATSSGVIWIASTAGLFEMTGIPFSAAIALTEPVLCEDESNATLSAIVIEGEAPFDYEWSPTDLSGAVNTDLPAGNYALTVTDATGATWSSSLVVENPMFNPRLVVRDSTATYSNISVLPVGTTPPFSYLWNDGSMDARRDSIPPGVYEVIVTDGNGCQKTLTYSFGIVSTNNIDVEFGVNIFPSVSDGLFNVTFEKSWDFNNSKIQIFDLNGRLLERVRFDNSISKIDLSDFKSGVYIIVFSIDNQRVTKKIIVNK